MWVWDSCIPLQNWFGFYHLPTPWNFKRRVWRHLQRWIYLLFGTYCHLCEIGNIGIFCCLWLWLINPVSIRTHAASLYVSYQIRGQVFCTLAHSNQLMLFYISNISNLCINWLMFQHTLIYSIWWLCSVNGLKLVELVLTFKILVQAWMDLSRASFLLGYNGEHNLKIITKEIWHTFQLENIPEKPVWGAWNARLEHCVGQWLYRWQSQPQRGVSLYRTPQPEVAANIRLGDIH